MDIRKFATEPTSTLHLRDAQDEFMYADGDESKPMRVTVYGPGSKVYAKAFAKKNSRLLDRVRSRTKSKASEEELQEEEAEHLASLTKSMENVSYGDLQGQEMFKAIYADLSIGFIADQVRSHIGEWGNFSPKSPTPSPSTSASEPGSLPG